jgi:hypothetical protein
MVPELTHWRWHMVPCSVRTVHAWFAHDVGQLAPSQSSPASSTPLPQTGEQLLSFTALHPPGQHPSPLAHAVCVPAVWHCAWQVPPLESARSVQPICEQVVGHEARGSHVSPTSTIPLPHMLGQSTSRLAGEVLHPGGQHPSLVAPLHGSCVVEHRALQVMGEPVNVLTSQHIPGAHAVGHVPGGSHVSPDNGSTTPSPQAAQSESFCAVHPAGQQRSLPAFEQVLPTFWHWTLQVAALPVWVSVVQSFWSSHAGHDPGGSQVSPASRRPLPHPAQSESVSAVHPLGQQPSRTVLLHEAALHGPASSAGPSIDASGGGPSGPTSPYVERCVVCAVAVPIEAFTDVDRRDHVGPLATASRRSAGATGAMSADWYR